MSKRAGHTFDLNLPASPEPEASHSASSVASNPHNKAVPSDAQSSRRPSDNSVRRPWLNMPQSTDGAGPSVPPAPSRGPDHNGGRRPWLNMLQSTEEAGPSVLPAGTSSQVPPSGSSKKPRRRGAKPGNVPWNKGRKTGPGRKPYNTGRTFAPDDPSRPGPKPGWKWNGGRTSSVYMLPPGAPIRSGLDLSGQSKRDQDPDTHTRMSKRAGHTLDLNLPASPEPDSPHSASAFAPHAHSSALPGGAQPRADHSGSRQPWLSSLQSADGAGPSALPASASSQTPPAGSSIPAGPKTGKWKPGGRGAKPGNVPWNKGRHTGQKPYNAGRTFAPDDPSRPGPKFGSKQKPRGSQVYKLPPGAPIRSGLDLSGQSSARADGVGGHAGP